MIKKARFNHKIKEELLDKASWGEGPWLKEPDRVEFEYKGLPCLMIRNLAVTGCWCGYVAIGPAHPLYEKSCQDIEKISVHGGLTYSEHCNERICHVPKPGEPDNVWWFGFDCSHFMDLMPRMEALMGRILPTGELGPIYSHAKYRDVAYVKKEIRGLARQLLALKK